MLDINLKQLEVFVTTAEYGSFTRAADVLYLSQSTVSRLPSRSGRLLCSARQRSTISRAVG